jgi:hypothetical protein
MSPLPAAGATPHATQECDIGLPKGDKHGRSAHVRGPLRCLGSDTDG